MKRELNKEERELEKKGLERNKKELEKIRYSLNFNKSLIDKQNYLRAWEDKWRMPERQRKDQEDREIIKMIESELKMKEESIKVGEKNIKEGVEVKIPTGVY